MTKAQQVYDRVEVLVASGAKKADAFRQVADELGMEFNSVRGAYYSITRKANGGNGGSRSRKRETTPQDAVAAAVATLRKAVENIDDEIASAKERAEEAQAEYQALRDGAKDKKAAIEAKISALES